MKLPTSSVNLATAITGHPEWVVLSCEFSDFRGAAASRLLFRFTLDPSSGSTQVYRGLPLMSRQLPHTLSTKIAPSELRSLQSRARLAGLTQSEYVRHLVLADLQSVNEYSLLQTVEAEHTRLVLLAAQQGKPLNATTLRELRSQAILNAPMLIEQTSRMLKQQRNGGR